MNTSEKYRDLEATINQLRGAKTKCELLFKNERCDKNGAGFNKDNRFAAFQIPVSFDTWHGYYGNSSCTTAVGFTDREAVKTAFIQWLNIHCWEILQGMADIMEKDAQAAKAVHIERLKAELARLEPHPATQEETKP